MSVPSPPVPFLLKYGKLLVPWNQWCQMFKNYLIVSDRDGFSPHSTKGSFASSLRWRSADLHRLPKPSPSTSSTATQASAFEQVINKLHLHLLCLIGAPFRFRRRGQDLGDDIDNSICALGGVASMCEFGNRLGEMLRAVPVYRISTLRVYRCSLLKASTFSLSLNS